MFTVKIYIFYIYIYIEREIDRLLISSTTSGDATGGPIPPTLGYARGELLQPQLLLFKTILTCGTKPSATQVSNMCMFMHARVCTSFFSDWD